MREMEIDGSHHANAKEKKFSPSIKQQEALASQLITLASVPHHISKAKANDRNTDIL